MSVKYIPNRSRDFTYEFEKKKIDPSISPGFGRCQNLLTEAGTGSSRKQLVTIHPSCSPRDSFGLENQNVMDPGTQNRSLPRGTNLSEMYDSISPFQKALEINASSQAKSDEKSSFG